MPLFGNSDCLDCEPGWDRDGVAVAENLTELTNPTGFMKKNKLVISYLKEDEHQGNYTCYGSQCVQGQCQKVLSEQIIEVKVVKITPQIKVDDGYAKKFHCRQEVPASYSEKVRFFINRLNGDDKELLSRHNFEEISEQYSDHDDVENKKFISQTFSRRLASDKDQLIGQYYCTTQFGKPSLPSLPSAGATGGKRDRKIWVLVFLGTLATKLKYI